ncbi:MAG: aminoglycoside phosphotransferase family protein [Candidatus Thermoplasmatota archaeon]|uniref:aminoglycoside phosphotransferase family protein n=1 Tax=Ferroplasma sp. TaxID=2591003 RepID=UPI0026274795|nr:aminoglycoside phosphotransferase family protein [Ferroplasma sp.]MCL4310886.1 aminoglycoside phosphotransferase family protein [Candidatus Thermoplasmatota archaeon]
MDKLIMENLISRIKNNFPEINIKKFYAIESGWMNYIIVINDSIVFRFPKTRKMVEKFQKEIRLLSILHNPPVKVPEYVFISKDEPIYGGYYKINGMPLNNSKTLGKGILSDFIRFLNYLKSYNGYKFHSNDIDIYNYKTWEHYENSLIQMFSESLADNIKEPYFNNIVNLMEAAFSDLEPDDFSLIHGDLSNGNVIISRRHDRLNGIIDWSDSCYGDIALDIAAIVDNYPIAALEPLLLNYEQKFSDRAIKRVLFYRAVSPLYYAHYMARTGNSDLKNYCERIINGRKYKIRMIAAEKMLKNK